MLSLFQLISMESVNATDFFPCANYPCGNLWSAQCWPSTDCRSPSIGVCMAPALCQHWLAMLGWTGCAVLETSTDSVLSNHWHTKMPDLSFLYQRLSTALIVEATFRQYWVNCQLSVLVNCTGPVLRHWWTPPEYRNFHLDKSWNSSEKLNIFKDEINKRDVNY